MDIKREDDCNSKPPSYQTYDGSNPIKQEIKVETEEIEIKREVEDNSYNFEQIFIPQCVLETRNQDSFHPVTVKKECESEEEASVTYEDPITEDICRNIIKLEDIKHSTTENEYIGHFSQDSYNSQSEDIKNDIDIKEHSLEIKEECMSKTLDGSTNEAVRSSNEKPKDIGSRNVLQMPFACNKPFACVICKKSFTHRGQLNKHMRFHSNERPFTCEICQKTFIHKYDVNSHMRIHTGERPHACNVCSKTFIQKFDLTLHLRIHTGERPFECGICYKKFMHKGNLNKHLNVHSGERSFECEVCKKTFSQNGYLTKHMRIHSGEKLYECEVCSKKFIQKCNFDAHMRIHFGERPFECEICKKRFISKGNLTKHLPIHSGDRPFECEVCKKKFINKSKLNEHMRVHSGERPYECQICNKRFLNKAKLNKHMLTHTHFVKVKEEPNNLLRDESY